FVRGRGRYVPRHSRIPRVRASPAFAPCVNYPRAIRAPPDEGLKSLAGKMGIIAPARGRWVFLRSVFVRGLPPHRRTDVPFTTHHLPFPNEHERHGGRGGEVGDHQVHAV